jgi:hypothetical protein
MHCNVGDLNGMLDQKVMEGEIDLIPVTKRGCPPSVLVQMHTGLSMTKNQPTVILNPGEDASVDADEAGARATEETEAEDDELIAILDLEQSGRSLSYRKKKSGKQYLNYTFSQKDDKLRSEPIVPAAIT